MSEEQIVSIDVSTIDFPDTLDLRNAAIYLEISEMRVRTLAKEGNIPCYKNEAGHWRFDLSDLEEFKANMGTRKGGYRRGDRKYWRIQIKHDDLEEVTELLADKFEIEVEPMYQYEKPEAEGDEDEDELFDD
jgi:excisionase family DNA binding protein